MLFRSYGKDYAAFEHIFALEEFIARFYFGEGVGVVYYKFFHFGGIVLSPAEGFFVVYRNGVFKGSFNKLPEFDTVKILSAI